MPIWTTLELTLEQRNYRIDAQYNRKDQGGEVFHSLTSRKAFSRREASDSSEAEG